MQTCSGFHKYAGCQPCVVNTECPKAQIAEAGGVQIDLKYQCIDTNVGISIDQHLCDEINTQVSLSPLYVCSSALCPFPFFLALDAQSCHSDTHCWLYDGREEYHLVLFCS